ncbi:hypothetical protein RND71_023418 [Anisodus tanguticus]|uniref:Uncharacterized protein n=1 Tax=Anisodus tanguticus TaxID=243964 RepID=A0AAE1RTV8_9SOLA|nr:hypothetical protein RND71_023418 [Anisodus tanguticus]
MKATRSGLVNPKSEGKKDMRDREDPKTRHDSNPDREDEEQGQGKTELQEFHSTDQIEAASINKNLSPTKKQTTSPLKFNEEKELSPSKHNKSTYSSQSQGNISQIHEAEEINNIKSGLKDKLRETRLWMHGRS